MDYSSIRVLGTRGAYTHDDWLAWGPHRELPWSDGMLSGPPKKALELLKHHPTLSPLPSLHLNWSPPICTRFYCFNCLIAYYRL